MTDETDGAFLARLGTDASKWASEFCKRWPSALCQIPGKEGVEDGANFEATMIGWFANAIETARDAGHAAALDLLAKRDAELARVREALAPSGDTKAAYMGEIKDPDTKRMVSWTAIKMVMKMITARAALTPEPEGGAG